MRIRYSFSGNTERIMLVFEGQRMPKIPPGSKLEGLELISKNDYILANKYIKDNNLFVVRVLMFGKYPPNLGMIDADVKLIVKFEMDPPYYNPPNVIGVYQKEDTHASIVVPDIGVRTYYEKVIFGKMSEFINLFKSDQNRVKRLVFRRSDCFRDRTNTISGVYVTVLDLSKALYDDVEGMILSFTCIHNLIIPQACIPLIPPDLQVEDIIICSQYPGHLDIDPLMENKYVRNIDMITPTKVACSQKRPYTIRINSSKVINYSEIKKYIIDNPK